mmetsp:Transcript_8770/g.18093  ORF Transcript_8770/g.18093 Transcript_8770/m.18093 type:complete len:211 (+) Transcript_8770:24-656(+)
MGFLKRRALGGSRVPRVQLTFSAPVLLTLCLLSGALLFSAKFSHEAMSLLPLSYYRWDRLTANHLRLLSWPLAHTGFPHFFHNYKMILLLGAPVEGHFGSRIMAWLCFLTSVVCALFHWCMTTNKALMGASGILYMLIGLHTVSGAGGVEIVGKGVKVPVTFVLVCVMFLAEEVWLVGTRDDQVSHLTHVVGGVVGVVWGYRWNNKKKRA